VLATVARVPPHRAAYHQLQIPNVSGTVPFFPPFADDPLVRVTPNGESIVIVERDAPRSEQGSFRVRRYDHRGRQTVESVHSFIARPITPRDVDSALAAAIRQTTAIRSSVGSEAILREGMLRVLYRPPYYPAVRSALVADDGSVWLQDMLAPDEWIMLDRAGRDLGRVSIPADIAPLWIGEGKFVGAIRDADDVPTIIRYGLVCRERCPR
jgi:hypothetical protein